jgi:hypothetical protein
MIIKLHYDFIRNICQYFEHTVIISLSTKCLKFVTVSNDKKNNNFSPKI